MPQSVFHVVNSQVYNKCNTFSKGQRTDFLDESMCLFKKSKYKESIFHLHTSAATNNFIFKTFTQKLK